MGADPRTVEEDTGRKEIDPTGQDETRLLYGTTAFSRNRESTP